VLDICLIILVVDDVCEVEYPASPISRAHLHELQSETSKLRQNGTIQQAIF